MPILLYCYIQLCLYLVYLFESLLYRKIQWADSDCQVMKLRVT